MSKDKKKKDISEKVMKDIKAHEVKMKPRVYFVLGSVVLGVSLAFLILFTSFFIHLVIYRMRVGLPQAFLGFGRMGLTPFLLNFPWIQLGLVVGGLLIGLHLLKRYDFSYKKNIWAVILIAVTLIVTLAAVIDSAGLDRRLEKVKPMGPLYRVNQVGANWVTGEVVEVSGDRIVIESANEKRTVVLWDGSALLRPSSSIEIGDQLKMVGEWDGEVFVAKGIAKGGNGRVKGLKRVNSYRSQKTNDLH